ncbi:Cell division protein FtsL [hydrothermal vent metagenome]|uniref:Cell division protein FtsL n=1 Tax=hydrothermal vent metagenome TaxID=652676 RepID=A0A161KG92_9ZZZZ
MNRQVVTILILGLGALLSAYGVVVSKQETRQQFQRLVALQNDRDELDIEWGQLQLEQSAWATHGRIESEARHILQMKLPRVGDAVLVSE